MKVEKLSPGTVTGVTGEGAVILMPQYGMEVAWLELAEAAGLVAALPLFEKSPAYLVKFPKRGVTKRGEAGRAVV